MTEEALQSRGIEAAGQPDPEAIIEPRGRVINLPSLRWLRGVRRIGPAASTAIVVFGALTVLAAAEFLRPNTVIVEDTPISPAMLAAAEPTRVPTLVPTETPTAIPIPTTSVARRMWEASSRYGRPPSDPISLTMEATPISQVQVVSEVPISTAPEYKKMVDERIKKAGILEDIDITILDKKMNIIIDAKSAAYSFPSTASEKRGLELPANTAYKVRAEGAPYGIFIRKVNPKRGVEFWYVLLPDQDKDQKVVFKKTEGGEEFIVNGSVAILLDTAPEGSNRPTQTFARLVAGK